LPEIVKAEGLSNPKVLDIGCGLGGMSAAYAADGGRVTAVDEELYDSESIRFAQEFARSKGVNVSYLAASENEWPFPDDTFDIVFLDSVIEHAKSPDRLLERAARALTPGGLMYVSFPVFFGPFGGHIYDYIRLPWYHLLPRSLVRATLRRCRPRGSYVTPELVEGIYLSLNRMSYRRFRSLLETLPLGTVRVSRSAFLTTAGNQLVYDVRPALAKRDWTGVWRSLRRIPRDFDLWSFCLFLFLLSTLPLMRIPYIQELFLGGIRASLQGRTGAE
jgi:SAM-dependent methyltransferase